MTPNLWFGARDFPMTPLFDWIPVFPTTLDLFPVLVFAGLLMLFIFRPTKLIGLSIVLLYVYLAMVDQTRIQPFFFEIIMIIFAMTLFSKDVKYVNQCILLIFIGTYFWSGIHKANSDFFTKWMLGMNNRIGFVPEQLRALFTISIPILEATFGVFLIFRKTRKFGVLLIALMHAIIVTTLFVEGYGFVVLPLTFFNVATLFILFYNSNLSVKEIFRFNHLKPILVFLLAIVFPIFNFFGYYDHLLSFSYFSGKPKYCRIWLTNHSDYKKLPKNISSYMYEWEGSYYVDLNYWSQESLGVGVYPEIRVYEKINQQFQKILEDKSVTKLELY